MARHAHRARSYLVPRALPLPTERSLMLTSLDWPSPVKRSPADTTSEAPARTTSCGPDDTTGFCERPVDSTTTMTLPIVLGAVIPLTCAFIAFFFLHRRHVKKLRLEDANDKHKSLDFGLDDMPSGRVKKGSTANGSSPMAEKSSRHAAHGVSMDLTLSSPYLLPPGLNGSHESIHSLSRSLHGEDDKYRTVAGFTAGDSSSMRSYSPSFRRGADDASTHTSPSAKYPYGDDMNQNLLKNAQRMSRSPPIIQTDPAESDLGQASNRSPSNSEYIAFSPSRGQLAVPTAVTNFDDLSVGNDNEKEPSVLRKSNNYLGALIHRGDASSPDNQGEHNTQAEKRNPLPSDSEKKEAMPDATSKAFEFKLEAHPDHNVPSAQTPRISLPLEDDKSDYGDEPTPFKHVTPQVQVQKPETAPVNRPPSTHETYDSYYDGGYQVDTRRLTMGIRPLPPEDPSENPEQRANRIRSFYKEYFDESKPQGDYYEDYDTTAYSAYDPFGQGAPRPFAQPEGRRAMTPPPRMPPLPAQYRQRNPDIGPPASASHSVATSVSSGPRAYSSASGRLASRAPKKPLPPPSPLHVLPTPHKLKDDSFLPIDFAPGMNAHDRRYGRPETPQGGLKPYMLTVPAHVPLASSYDDLAILPSPHALRKSGTFTALDFVAPSRFNNAEGGSDTGSIRSNRTGLSAAQAYSIRTGAYRISRLPPQTVGTKDDIISNLRPTWDMNP